LNTVLIRLVILLLPIIVFLGWRYLVHRRAVARGAPGLNLTEGPWAWLLAGGLVLVILSFFVLAFTTGEEPGGVYVPPRYEDGKIIPGHTIR
jgi:hypothetical protein